MNLDELRSVQNTERRKDSLQHLRESFYEDVAAYLAELQEQRDRAAAEAEDPFGSPEVRRLTDEIETAREVTRAIYERRLGKLVKRASLAAADMPADEEGLTAEERELFSDLVDRMERNKSHVLEVVEGESDPIPGDAGSTTPEPAGADTAGDDASNAAPEREEIAPAEAAHVAEAEESSPDGDDDAGAGGDPATPADREPGRTRDVDADPEAKTPEDDSFGEGGADGLDGRTTVRITRDVGEIFGVDEREYDLTAETVVTLPAENAEPLLDRGAAERIE